MVGDARRALPNIARVALRLLWHAGLLSGMPRLPVSKEGAAELLGERGARASDAGIMLRWPSKFVAMHSDAQRCPHLWPIAHLVHYKDTYTVAPLRIGVSG